MSSVTVSAADGGSFQAYHAAPPGGGSAPGLVVIQEIFGVNQVMREISDAYAALGYHVLCPDIFWRIEPGIEITDKTQEEWNQAFDLFGKFDAEKGVSDLISTIAHLRSMTNCTGKIGTVGYCLGGKMAYLMAARSDAECSVSYYGVGLEGMLDEKSEITNPYMSHIASKDQFVPPEAQAQITTALGEHPMATLHIYDGQDHAFARHGGQHYDEAAAKLANDRTAAFFHSHLS
ncbi:MAG: dienelactone hydrolase family protein [Rhodospirillaceae bacterium]|jgi:carboxymethylenebutenolidase|nr:dienelactone hydrolase family protein [Rhodospirillaceae bacterium]MBT6136874.1 dienelactone hydrolase family protein [Rhodospirillaceae bacterium]